MQTAGRSTLLVETRGLTKRYGPRITAVSGLDLNVRRGEVYGFLGPNGSGKTTISRMLLGLVRPTKGTATVLGHAPGAPAGLRKVGSLVESPAFYPYLSGRENLRVMARYAGASRERVHEVIKMVELVGREHDKVKQYPLGMKQRLGVAAALLKDPELLILDEPTNGLDPRGVADMRGIISRIGEDGKTVLLSSHLLGEVEQTCDRVGIVREGRMVAEASVKELRGGRSLALRVDQPERALAVAGDLPGVERAWTIGEGILRIATTGEGRAAEINAGLVRAGVSVSELRPVERSLEEVYLRLTGSEGEERDAG